MNRYLLIILFGAMLPVIAGCERKNNAIQGYLEADMVYVGPVSGGKVEQINVRRGDMIKKGSLLFIQDRTEQQAGLSEADANLKKAKADLRDLMKGFRQEELNALQAKIARMESIVKLDNIEFQRSLKLREQDAISAKEFDNTRLGLERDKFELEEARHRLSIGKLAARPDRITMAEEAIQAAVEAQSAARWRYDQRQANAPYDSMVFDVLMRDGEYAAQGAAVVALLPVDKLKVRFFVNSSQAAKLVRGQKIEFHTHAMSPAYSASIDYIAPKPEFTPPVIYSNDNSEKLSFMIEANADPSHIAELHPGLPVTIKIIPGVTP